MCYLNTAGSLRLYAGAEINRISIFRRRPAPSFSYQFPETFRMRKVRVAVFTSSKTVSWTVQDAKNRLSFSCPDVHQTIDLENRYFTSSQWVPGPIPKQKLRVTDVLVCPLGAPTPKFFKSLHFVASTCILCSLMAPTTCVLLEQKSSTRWRQHKKTETVFIFSWTAVNISRRVLAGLLGAPTSS